MPNRAHKQAQDLASRAALLARDGQDSQARDLYRRAAEFEQRAVEQVPREKSRTWGILAVSAASLLYKARQFEEAELLLHSYLRHPDLASGARQQLRELLDVVLDEQTLPHGYRYSPQEIEVFLRGGDVGRGTAPLEVVLEKWGELRSLVTRALEWRGGAPFRKRGAARPEIAGALVARVTQPAAGSYRFTIKLAAPPQMELFPGAEPVSVEGVTESLFQVLGLGTTGDPGDAAKLRELIPDPEYRVAMLKLIRNVVPADRSLGEIELRRTCRTDDGDVRRDAVVLTKDTRPAVAEAIKLNTPPRPTEEAAEIRGVLRAVHLDEDWLVVVSDDREIRVHGAGEVVDDVIGPMVNRHVVVHGFWRSARGGERAFHLADIDLAPEGR